jgi:serpin B
MNSNSCSVVVICLLLSGILAAFADDSLQGLVKADNDFSYRLVRSLAAAQPGSNVFVSPYLTASGLRLMAGAADGQTRAELLQALGVPGVSDEGLRLQCQTEAQLVEQKDTNVALSSARALWYDQHLHLQPGFSGAATNALSEIKPVDFQQGPEAEAEIDSWVSDRTGGKIHDLAHGLIDPGKTVMAFTSAAYFKGTWAIPFDKTLTAPKPFHSADGRSNSLPMMNQSGNFTYREDISYKTFNAADGKLSMRKTEILEAVELPYQGGSLAMRLFLPGEGIKLDRVLQVLGQPPAEFSDDGHYLSTGFIGDQGSIWLPRFKLETTSDLDTSLRLMGIKAAMDPFRADFSKAFAISPGSYGKVFLAGARQKAFLMIDEAGTEAAAASGLNYGVGAVPFDLVFDRPFIFEITDQRTGLILFLGLVNHL